MMDNFFIFRENTHNLRNFEIILNENKKTIRYGSETISYRTPLLWANIPEEYKLANSLSEFKSKIKLGNVIHVSVDYADLSFRLTASYN